MKFDVASGFLSRYQAWKFQVCPGGGTVSTVLAGVAAGFATALPVAGSAEVYCDETTDPDNTADIAIDTFDASSPSIVVSLSNGPANQFTVLLVGDGMNVVANPPGSKGTLCMTGGQCVGRYAEDIGAISSAGTRSIDIEDALSDPCSGAVVLQPGLTWNFQWWHRQPMGQPSSFSAAIRVTFE